MSHELVALIRTSPDGNYDKRQGDVICVKLAEHASWGKKDLSYHQPIPWDDDNLKQIMENSIANNEQPYSEPIICLPYKQVAKSITITGDYDPIGPVDVTKTRSSKYFNINGIQDETLKANILNNNSVVDLSEFTEEILTSCTISKTEEQINQEYEQNKTTYFNMTLTPNPAYTSPSIAAEERETLSRYVRNLKQYYNVDAKIIDGKIAIIEQGEF